ncbi:MAG: leucine-rich repeat domain-containing protein, partial [Clostridia bacterium]|nr:leucine-rich repeat domain-containing protein [Clostridia bacterium]
CENLKIYAEASAKQSGWHERWNGERPVVWDYKAGAGTSVTPKTEEVKNVEKKEIPSLRKKRAPISGLASFLNKEDFEIENGVLKKYNGKGGDVVIPSEVKEIGDRAFYNCENVTSVVIPHGVTCIGRSLLGGGGVFNGCKNLKSVVIPSSVTNIEYGSFDNCPNLTIYAEITDKPTGWIKDIKWQRYWNYSCPVVWGYKIGNSTNDFEVENTTFKTVLKKYKGKGGDVVIPDGVTDIAENAFANCDKVTSVTFPKTANFLTRAMTSSGVLSSMNIARKVFGVGENAFSGCLGLKSIVIPISVTDIAKNTFKDCPNLTIYAEMQNEPENWVNGVFTGRWNPDNRPVVWGYKAGAGTSVTPKTETQNPDFEIENGVLKKYNGKGGDVVIPSEVKEIGGKVFFDCQSLLSIKIPKSVTTIGEHAFSCCKGLKTINFSNGVENIGEFAFSNCENLETVKFPNSMTSIGCGAFMTCKRLQEVILPNELISMGGSVFMECFALKSIKFPKNMSEIPRQTCTDCYSLKSVILPNKLQSIGKIAFRNCGFLETIVIPKTVTQILGGAFLKCSSLKIYAEIKEKDKPAYNFDTGDCPVVWGYKPLFGGFGVKK